MESKEAGGSLCSRVEDQDWAKPAGRVASEAVLKLKTTLEMRRLMLDVEKQQRLSVGQRLPRV